jgi:hypothetical protein
LYREDFLSFARGIILQGKRLTIPPFLLGHSSYPYLQVLLLKR